MAGLSMEDYEDFVLKLKIKSVDGTSQIRRVRLPRIADAAGNLSYEELVGLVVTFHFPEGSPDLFICSLTYFDEDEDTVTIASNAELVDAVEQFTEKRVLRISTEVKPRKTPASGASAPQTTVQLPGNSANRTDRGTSTATNADIQPNIQNVLDSVVGVLATAVTSIEKGLTAPPPTTGGSPSRTPAASEKPLGSGTFAGNKVGKFAAAKPPCIEISVGNAGPKSVTAFVHGRHTCDSCLKTPIVGNRYHAANRRDYDLCESCFKNYSGKETEFVEYPSEKKITKLTKLAPKPKATPKTPEPKVTPKTPEPPAESDSAPQPETAPKPEIPFIHGRHTCDSCLKTPIVGERFHATNIKDYDLCASCHDNYSGTEIEFEAVELPRDRAFQKRWSRRRQRIESMQRRGRGRRCGPRYGRHAPAPEAPSPLGQGNAEDSAARIIPIQTTSAPPEQNDEFDDALEEAIRRSLEDSMPTEAADTQPAEESLPVVEPSAPTEAELGATHEPVDVSIELKSESAVDQHVDAPVLPSMTLTDGSVSTDLESVDERLLLQSMEETMSVNSENMVSEDGDRKPAAVSLEDSPASPERKTCASELDTNAASPKTVSDDSFALDAVGNGDVAEAMGATLDIMAGVISEMLNEADSHNSPKAAEQAMQVNAAAPEQVEKDAAGALILTAGREFEDREEDDWQVVNENGEQNTDIANATQMLGSALFNSDLKSSSENFSALTNSDCFSAATSVPSSVPSIHLGTDVSYVSPAQLDRWASQLEKLHELGFDDERKCVETLERLHAANIGCDVQDEISVTKVVNAMFEQN